MAYTDVEYKFRKLGRNVQIARNVYFRYPNEVEIGDNVIIDEFCYFTTQLKIGDYVHISPLCSVIGGIKSRLVMKDFSGFAAGCRIVCGSESYLGDGMTNPTIPEKYRASLTSSTVIINKHAVLGTNCVVHPGVIIGEGVALGSLTLVTKSLEPWVVYIGVPARKIDTRERKTILKYERELRKEEQEMRITIKK